MSTVIGLQRLHMGPHLSSAKDALVVSILVACIRSPLLVFFFVGGWVGI
jgi:hypothetical protein